MTNAAIAGTDVPSARAPEVTGAKVSAPANLIFARPEAEVRHYPATRPGGPHLIVCPGGNPRQQDPAEWADSIWRRLSDDGAVDIAVISDIRNDWLSTPGLRAEIALVLRQNIERLGPSGVVGLGLSSGGTSLICLSAMVPFETVLAVGPQIEVGPPYHGFDPRARKWDRWLPDPAERPEPLLALQDSVQYLVLHGLQGPDAAHAALCPRAANIRRYVFPDCAHKLTPRLGVNRRFERLVAAMLHNDLAGFDDVIRESAGLNPDLPPSTDPAETWRPYSDEALADGDMAPPGDGTSSRPGNFRSE